MMLIENKSDHLDEIDDFEFQMSPEDIYYQFYKNAPRGTSIRAGGPP